MSKSNRLLTAVLLQVDWGCSYIAWTQTSEAERVLFGIASPSVALRDQMLAARAALTTEEQRLVNTASSAEFDRLYVGSTNRPAMLRRAAELSAPTTAGSESAAALFDQAVEADVQWRVICNAWHNSTEAERTALGLSPPTDAGYAPVRRATERLNLKDQARVNIEGFYRFSSRYAKSRLSILEAATPRSAQQAAPNAPLPVQAPAAPVPKPPVDPWAATVAKLSAKAAPATKSIDYAETYARFNPNRNP